MPCDQAAKGGIPNAPPPSGHRRCAARSTWSRTDLGHAETAQQRAAVLGVVHDVLQHLANVRDVLRLVVLLDVAGGGWAARQSWHQSTGRAALSQGY